MARRYYRTFRPEEDPEGTIRLIEGSGQLWGAPARNTFASHFPKVKAYAGPLPEGRSGYEFETDVAPDRGCVPGQPTWSGPREGVVVEDDWAKIKVRLTKVVFPA